MLDPQLALFDLSAQARLAGCVRLQTQAGATMIPNMTATATATATEPITPTTDTLSTNGHSSYAPLSSVWTGSDGELIEAMLKFYAVIAPGPILDATHNAGRFWKGSKRKVVSMDIDPQHNRMVGDVSSHRRWQPVTGKG